MSINDVIDKTSPDASIIQNRLTVTGFAITALIFSGSFSLSLFQTFHREGTVDFRTEFLHIEVAIGLGMVFSVLTLGCFLLAQHLGGNSSSVSWYNSRRWWFSVGQILLFLALSQALSSSLTEVVYGIGLKSKALGFIVGLLALPVWLVLLFVGPISFIRRVREVITGLNLQLLVLIYGLAILAILVLNAWSYTLQNNEEFSVGTFMREFLYQFVQPLTWHKSWG